MKKCNKSKLTRFTAVLGISVLLMGVSASAYSGAYISYTLPRFSGNNYTGTHAKETSSSYIVNTVTAVSNTSKATFWATNSDHTQISKDYVQKAGNSSTIYFTEEGYNKKDVEVCLGMENGTWSTSYAFVSGTVDFK